MGDSACHLGMKGRRLTSTPTPGGVRTGAAGMPQVRNQAGVSGIVFGACLMGGWAVLFLVDPVSQIFVYKAHAQT